MSERHGSTAHRLLESGSRIRLIRETWSDALPAVANFLGCDILTLHRVECGELELDEFSIARLAKLWGVTPEYLRGEPGAAREPKVAPGSRVQLREYLLRREAEFGQAAVLGPRVRVVLRFLMKAAPSYYTHDFVARAMHLSVPGLRAVLQPEAYVCAYTIRRVHLFSGIPERWFWQAQADLVKAEAEPPREDDSSTMRSRLWTPKFTGPIDFSHEDRGRRRVGQPTTAEPPVTPTLPRQPQAEEESKGLVWYNMDEPCLLEGYAWSTWSFGPSHSERIMLSSLEQQKP